MVIRPSETVQRQMREIFDYYVQEASWEVAHKVCGQIQETIDRLLIFPTMGVVEPDLKPRTYRSIVAHPNYKVIYYIEEVIFITGIWACRQDPGRLKSMIEKG